MPYDPTNNPYIPGDPYSYDLKWMVDKIQEWTDPLDSAERAEAAEAAAKVSEQEAEAWAVGTKDGDPVTSDDPQYENNSKYWSDEAASSASNAAASEAAAADYADHIADPVSGIVTQWLQDNITQPTTPAIDRSLTTLDAAADAKTTGVNINIAKYIGAEVGDNFIDLSNVSFTEGYYISNVSTGAIAANTNAAVSDFIPVTKYMKKVLANRVLYTSNGTSYPNNNVICCYDADQNVISNAGKVNSSHCSLVTLPANCAYIRATFDRYYVPRFLYVPLASEYELTAPFGLIGEYHNAFTAAQQVKGSGIYLEPDTSYIVRFYSDRTQRINLFAQGYSSAFYPIFPNENEVIVHNPAADERVLNLYNVDGDLMNIDIKVFAMNSVISKAQDVPTVYRVSKNIPASAAYHSLTQLLLDLKDDHSPKIIEIDSGEYDILQEYQDANVPVYTGNDPTYDYYDYCVWVPENTHIIGKGIVKLVWAPDPGDVTLPQSKTVSPLNVGASCTIENIEVHCKNGRYCLHSDVQGKVQFNGARQIYKNVVFHKYANEIDPDSGTTYGFNGTIGFGIDAKMSYRFENCTFIHESTGIPFYGHIRITSPSNEYESPDITVNNCTMVGNGSYSVKLGNASTNTNNIRVRTLFSNCYFNHTVLSARESDNGTCANVFDITFLGCGNVTLKMNDPSNPYSPKAYNTNLTVI